MKNSTAFIRAAVIGASIAASSVPAFAADTKDSEKAQLTLDKKTGKYCYKASLTGSRMQKSICRTREQWVEEGVKLPEASGSELAKK
ncbi:hypothetical protein [Sphingomonas cavernae]|uniref:Uncharacterized protein n=1 Tax=Sphingomonas cavernae TaxID=2320861 RepID=A0A418WLU3_9SPHN|nr:hypothetical protein [Sphingomonas cavernae]RJF90970.1 hypothetical protein D3876_12500 [Sphingomonas cavernae]